MAEIDLEELVGNLPTKEQRLKAIAGAVEKGLTQNPEYLEMAIEYYYSKEETGSSKNYAYSQNFIKIARLQRQLGQKKKSRKTFKYVLRTWPAGVAGYDKIKAEAFGEDDEKTKEKKKKNLMKYGIKHGYVSDKFRSIEIAEEFGIKNKIKGKIFKHLDKKKEFWGAYRLAREIDDKEMIEKYWDKAADSLLKNNNFSGAADIAEEMGKKDLAETYKKTGEQFHKIRIKPKNK